MEKKDFLLGITIGILAYLLVKKTCEVIKDERIVRNFR